MFQSTGSYEPWRAGLIAFMTASSFNPRALTSPDDPAELVADAEHVSIHGLLRALTWIAWYRLCLWSFNPRALTSPDWPLQASVLQSMFQSTGSYEPWRQFQTNYLLKIAAYFISFTIQTTIVNNMLISLLNHAQSVRWAFVHVV